MDSRNFMNTLRYDRMNCFQRPGLSLTVSQGLLPDDIELSPKMGVDDGGLSNEWCFTGSHIHFSVGQR